MSTLNAQMSFYLKFSKGLTGFRIGFINFSPILFLKFIIYFNDSYGRNSNLTFSVI